MMQKYDKLKLARERGYVAKIMWNTCCIKIMDMNSRMSWEIFEPAKHLGNNND